MKTSSHVVRLATTDDAAELQRIYAPIARDTAISFEEVRGPHVLAAGSSNASPAVRIALRDTPLQAGRLASPPWRPRRIGIGHSLAIECVKWKSFRTMRAGLVPLRLFGTNSAAPSDLRRLPSIMSGARVFQA